MVGIDAQAARRLLWPPSEGSRGASQGIPANDGDRCAETEPTQHPTDVAEGEGGDEAERAEHSDRGWRCEHPGHAGALMVRRVAPSPARARRLNLRAPHR